MTRKQFKIFRLFLENYTVTEICKKVKVKKQALFLDFIFIGKRLAIYEWLFCKIIPKKTSKQYLEGFKDYEKLLIQELKDAGIKK